jgi:hypothetical protein
MSDNQPPEPPHFDWREFVDEMREKRLHREFNRPSQLLRMQSVRWRSPDRDRPFRKLLGRHWQSHDDLD